jgi:hypothetical protein
MKKILLSLSTITALVAMLVIGATGAFLADTETAVGNTFTAGAIDLKVDNESYYNGAVSTATSWQASDLGQGLLFFNFRDLKPDDEGEDTISLHVNSNDAWMCMDVTLTSNDDNSSNPPELASPDAQNDPNNTWDGELAQNVRMFWWADDGDNVYEEGESSISGGVKTLMDLASTTGTFSVALADSANNIWTNTPGPLSGNTTKYIAKAWCFGNLTLTPLAQDGLGTDGPLAPNRVGTGVSCDGKALSNLTQTDGATLDVAFRAVQARHNPNFFCSGQDPRTAKLTVVKVVVNDNGGNNVVSDYQLAVVGTVVTNVTSGVETTFATGNYIVTETGISGYQASFSGDCNVAGQVTLAPGDVKTCIITNNDISPNITLIKNVVNDSGGTAVPVMFTMRIDGNVVPQSTSVPVIANSAHTINEDSVSGYHFVSITGSAKCPLVLGGTATLDEGEAITCTITNSDNGGGL